MNTRSFTATELMEISPKDLRSIIRLSEWAGLTVGACRNYAQANLAVLPKEHAFDFLLFCSRNPRPCYTLDVTEPSDPHPKLTAPDADLRTDLPKYRIFKNGELVDEPTDATSYWSDDLVAFLIGCSLSFDWALKAANVSFRYLGDYTTNIPLVAAGRFCGHMVCSCRVFPTSYDAMRAIQISSRHIAFHGPPVHIGDPTLIGVNNIGEPDTFVPPWPTSPPEPHEIVMLWGCGVTPQVVAVERKVPFMITHCPGHMFITDRLNEELAIL